MAAHGQRHAQACLHAVPHAERSARTSASAHGFEASHLERLTGRQRHLAEQEGAPRGEPGTRTAPCRTGGLRAFAHTTRHDTLPQRLGQRSRRGRTARQRARRRRHEGCDGRRRRLRGRGPRQIRRRGGDGCGEGRGRRAQHCVTGTSDADGSGPRWAAARDWRKPASTSLAGARTSSMRSSSRSGSIPLRSAASDTVHSAAPRQ